MRLTALIATLVFIADQALKYAVVYGVDLQNRLAVDVLPPLLNLRMAWNRGVNFGLFTSEADIMRWVLIALALGISGFVLIWAARDGRTSRVYVSVGLLVGGALGNAVDRVVFGAVADFLNMSCCGFQNPYSFNLADIAVFAGAIGLIAFADSHKTP